MKKIGYLASESAKAQLLSQELLKHNKMVSVEKDQDVEVIVVIGGDGKLLHAMHKFMHLNIPFYGLNAGSIGFLMNEPTSYDIKAKIAEANITNLHPLKMTAFTQSNKKHEAIAVNEVSIFRKTNQSVKLQIKVDNIVRMEELVADGALVSTAAGSSAYNVSAGGTIIPFNTRALCLTPICPFRPRRWKGAILPHQTKISFELLEYERRSANVAADFIEYSNIVRVDVEEDKSNIIQLMYDENHSLQDRIIKEQFIA